MLQALLIAVAVDMILSGLPTVFPRLEGRLPLGGSHAAQFGALVLVALGTYGLWANLLT